MLRQRFEGEVKKGESKVARRMKKFYISTEFPQNTE
jgi:hypothetical protein